MEMPPIVGDNTCRFLATMLQGVKAQGGQGGSVLMAENAENAAFFAKPIITITGKAWVEGFGADFYRLPIRFGVEVFHRRLPVAVSPFSIG